MKLSDLTAIDAILEGAFEPRPENAKMTEFLDKNGIKGVKSFFLWDGSMKGNWMISKRNEKWSSELVDKFNSLGFTDGFGKPLDMFSGNGGSFSTYVHGHNEFLKDVVPPKTATFKLKESTDKKEEIKIGDFVKPRMGLKREKSVWAKPFRDAVKKGLSMEVLTFDKLDGEKVLVIDGNGSGNVEEGDVLYPDEVELDKRSRMTEAKEDESYKERLIHSVKDFDGVLKKFEGKNKIKIYFLLADGQALSFDTAQEEYKLISSAIKDGGDDQWKVIGWEYADDEHEADVMDAHTGKIIVKGLKESVVPSKFGRPGHAFINPDKGEYDDIPDAKDIDWSKAKVIDFSNSSKHDALGEEAGPVKYVTAHGDDDIDDGKKGWRFVYSFDGINWNHNMDRAYRMRTKTHKAENTPMKEAFEPRPENSKMTDFLADKGIKGVKPFFIWDGSMKGCWRLYFPGVKNTPELTKQLSDAGFKDFDGKDLHEFSSSGGDSAQYFVMGHNELLKDVTPPKKATFKFKQGEDFPKENTMSKFETALLNESVEEASSKLSPEDKESFEKAAKESMFLKCRVEIRGGKMRAVVSLWDGKVRIWESSKDYPYNTAVDIAKNFHGQESSPVITNMPVKENTTNSFDTYLKEDTVTYHIPGHRDTFIQWDPKKKVADMHTPGWYSPEFTPIAAYSVAKKYFKSFDEFKKELEIKDEDVKTPTFSLKKFYSDVLFILGGPRFMDEAKDMMQDDMEEDMKEQIKSGDVKVPEGKKEEDFIYDKIMDKFEKPNYTDEKFLTYMWKNVFKTKMPSEEQLLKFIEDEEKIHVMVDLVKEFSLSL